MSLITQYRSYLRKKIAELKISGKNNSESVKLIAEYRKKISEGASEEEINKTLQPRNDLTYGKLLTTLESLMREEEQEFKTQAPSQTDIERWALKYAVLEFYKSLGLSQNVIVIDNPASGKTIHEYAPNTDKIYALWMGKLHDLTKKDDVNQFSANKYDTNFDRGTPRGGSFEKQLQRYREEFVKRMISF